MENVLEQVPFDFVYHAAAEFGRMNGEDFYRRLAHQRGRDEESDQAAGAKTLPNGDFLQFGDLRRLEGLMEETRLTSTPLKQMNDYAITKWVNELQVTNSVAKNGTETVIVRLFNTYGPGEPFSDIGAWSAGSFMRAAQPTVYGFSSHHRSLTYIATPAELWGHRR